MLYVNLYTRMYFIRCNNKNVSNEYYRKYINTCIYICNV